MITYEESEKIDKPSCLDAAIERQAILNGSVVTRATFPENEKYLTGSLMLEDYTQSTDGQLEKTFGDCGWHMSKQEKTGIVKGLKFDEEKPRYELIPPEAIDGVAQVLTMGARKYGSRNWESGIVYGRIFSACMRHLWAWWKGEKIDPESGLSHLHHAACNIMMLQTYDAREMVNWDDRPSSHK